MNRPEGSTPIVRKFDTQPPNRVNQAGLGQPAAMGDASDNELSTRLSGMYTQRDN